MPSALSVSDNLKHVEKEISAACQRSGRRREDVQLVLVSKTVSPELILEAYRLGYRHFGENRVQELLKKCEALPRDIQWHLIGHLQSNKAKDAVGAAVMIQSLDSLELARELAKICRKKGLNDLPCLLQVNVSGESTKFGASPVALKDFAAQLDVYPELKIKGLMTLGPLTDNQELIRKVFRNTRELADQMRASLPGKDWSVLSMGMSGDYVIAIEEGATLIRVGSAIFGDRPAVN